MMRRNAWAIMVTREKAMLYAGKAIEIQDNFVAEGAWAGEFSARGLCSSSFRCGSGAILENDRIVLCAPSHSLDPIYCFIGRGQVIAANSLHLIIALQEAATPPDFLALTTAAGTLKRGRIEYERILYAGPAGTMARFAFGTVSIDRATLALTESVAIGQAVPTFEGYRGYRAYLISVLRSLLANARTHRRGASYGDLITTCSRGYDSAACAALAKELGCSEALTLRTGRGGNSDSGSAVAAALGLTTREYERFGLDLERKDSRYGEVDTKSHKWRLDVAHLLPEHNEFLASINTAEDLIFSAMEPHLENAIVLTGFHGDKAWAMGCPSGPHVTRGDNSGSGIDEFRKRVGFVNVPVPFIGVENHMELEHICQSEDMAAYRLDCSYDRPIPRRLAEDMGVPRKAFGMKKSAGSIILRNAVEARRAAFLGLVCEYRDALHTAAEVRLY